MYTSVQLHDHVCRLHLLLSIGCLQRLAAVVSAALLVGGDCL
jgi:hypothetical protein